MLLIILGSIVFFTLVACTNKIHVSSTAEISSQDDTQELVGAFGEEAPLTVEEQEIFSEATAQLVGIKYTPITVSTQIVAGTNYCFRCSGETGNANHNIKEYYLTVYVSLDSDELPVVTNISEI